MLVANKAEANGADAGFIDAYALGLGEPVAISAEHGEGMGDLRDAIVEALGAEAFADEVEGTDDDADVGVAVEGEGDEEVVPPMMPPSRSEWRSSAARTPASRR